ncbi:hypothetical protein EE612_027879 [Oryza sativa]|nr:hypothetical protein EE612_027879 [Oryza sativa]
MPWHATMSPPDTGTGLTASTLYACLGVGPALSTSVDTACTSRVPRAGAANSTMDSSDVAQRWPHRPAALPRDSARVDLMASCREPARDGELGEDLRELFEADGTESALAARQHGARWR